MANGKIRFGKQSGGQLALVFPDGVTNTEVIVPESGELATKEYVDINSFSPTPIIATGTATFNSTTNNIKLTGIGVGLEVGDVIQISGAEDSKNNSEFTVEVITDANNIIVNQGHANKGTIKNVATRASDPNVTVKLLAKYYNAPPSLGRYYVNMAASRTHSTSYPNNTKREMIVSVEIGAGNPQGCQAYVDGKRVVYSVNTTPSSNTVITFTVPAGSVYLANNNGVGGSSVNSWHELR